VSASNLHSAWARLFLRALATSGVTDVVVSPGSRSTPLTLAAAAESGVRCHVIIDERAAGFFALGQARLTGRPSVLLCTSGTAGAHYLPALIEANQCGLPLLVVTADRPWEAYDAAAPQTIDQVKLFGGQVRHYAELGLPDPSATSLRAVVRVAAQSVRLSRGPVPGPVHINARFRKPLEPVAVATREPWEPEFERLMELGAPVVHAAPVEAPMAAVQELRRAFASAERPVLVCGPLLGPAVGARWRDAVRSLAHAAGAPVLAEASSQVRFGGGGPEAPVCGAFDALLRDPSFRTRCRPDLIVEFGLPPVSPGYAAWVQEHPSAARFVVAPHGWNDPLGGASALVFGDPVCVAAEVATALGTPSSPRNPDWTSLFAQAEAAAWRCVSTEFDEGAFTEGVVAHRVVEALPPRAVLMVGNSMPVRDLDTYCPPSARPLTVLHQRGASGIDGLVSGAAGARSITGEPVVLFLGDVSLLHDLTGLNVARRVPGPFVVVVVQNDGGRIFEQLPIGRSKGLDATFETFFATPQRLAFEPAAAMFGFDYARAESPSALDQALANALSGTGHTLIEAVVAPHEGSARRASLWQRVAASLATEGTTS
jgi:2-succinyl-5-enolpyruvyl-6-hydroxy-3-cyclohexene-1-carboxylate synthase